MLPLVLHLQHLIRPPPPSQHRRPTHPRYNRPHRAHRHRRPDLHELRPLLQIHIRRLVQLRRRAHIIHRQRERLPPALELPSDIGGFVVNDFVGAEVLAELDVGRGARGRDVASYGFCELDAEGAGAAGAAVDEDAVVGLRVGDDALVGYQGGGADGGGVVGVDAGWEGGGAGEGGDDVLAHGAEAGGRIEAAEDGLVGGEGGGGAAGGEDAPAEVDAGGGGPGDEEAAD